VILLANAIHPRGNAPISALRSQVATAAAKALGIGANLPTHRDEAAINKASSTSTGIDVLEATQFAALKEAALRHGGKLRVGLLTNQTGLDSKGRRTIDVLRGAGGGIELVHLFSPEHGIFGAKDSTEIGQEVDPASGLKVTSLYGAKDADRRPEPEDLKDLDAVVIDLQDAGVRFYTYETVVGYFLETASAQRAAGHDLEVIVLDRPGLTAETAPRGPISDPGKESYTNYMPEPVQLGMTLGELAKFIVGERIATLAGDSAGRLAAMLTVIPMQNWQRDEYFDQTGLTWVNPSPNLRTVAAATLYPGMALLETTNVSVGRGTQTPFEVFGAGVAATTHASAASAAPAQAAWLDGKAVAAYLTARRIPGVTFAPTTYAVAEDANKYPYHGQTIEGVRVTVTDRAALDAPEMGVEILSALHHLYPQQFGLEKAMTLVANAETMAALERGDDPRDIARSWGPALAAFRDRREKYLLYH
jgi:uncharacterized protein YbbC (DUF1343 family)